MTDLPDSIRGRFPILADAAYANTCSQGALSVDVRAAYERYLRDWDERGAPWELWVEHSEAVRQRFARLLNATEDEIAITTSVSAGVSTLLSGLRFADGRNKIVVSDLEFPTIGQISHAQELLGRKVTHVPTNDDNTLRMDRLAEEIDGETGLVCITYVSFRTGTKNDVAEVIRLAHEAGALVLVDAFQAIGAIPIDVRDIGAEFVTGGALKYLLGSSGLGFLYCRGDLLGEILPTQTGWFADEDIFKMDIYDYSPSPTARRFEAGTPAVPNMYAGAAGLDLMHEVGIAETERHVNGLVGRFIEGLDRIGARMVTPRVPHSRGPLICVSTKDDYAMVAALADDGILTTPRDGSVRVSFHCYNSEEDVERIVDGLERHADLLAR